MKYRLLSKMMICTLSLLLSSAIQAMEKEVKAPEISPECLQIDSIAPLKPEYLFSNASKTILYQWAASEPLPALIQLIRSRNFAEILRWPEDTNVQDSYGTTALMYAVAESSENMAAALICKGAHINAQDNTGCTALMWAARGSLLEMTNILLVKGADPNVQDDMGWTALFYALQADEGTFVSQRSYQIIRLLLNHGANPKLEDTNKRTIPWFATLWGKSSIVKLLLEGNVERPAENLQIDSILQKEPATQFPIKLYFDQMAASETLPELIQLVRKHDLDRINQWSEDINVQDSSGATPLMYAVAESSEDMIIALLQHGANINAQNNAGMTALMWAAKGSSVEVTDLLLKHGANTNIQGETGVTALILAIQSGNLNATTEKSHQIVKLLLDKGANPNLKAIHGNDALFWAQGWKDQIIIKLLLDNGAKNTGAYFTCQLV